MFRLNGYGASPPLIVMDDAESSSVSERLPLSDLHFLGAGGIVERDGVA